LARHPTQTQRCSPILNEQEITEIERKSDLNLIGHFAAELRKIELGASPCEVLNESIRRKLVKSGMLRRWKENWTLSDECRKILRIR
jgi:hypothetical protein